jgi:N-acetylneuraminic acid mutarotase
MRMSRRTVPAVLVLAALLGVVPAMADAPEADNGTGVGTPPAVGTQGSRVTPNDPWVALAPCPIGVSRPAGAFVDGHFFVIGGEETGGVRTGYVQEYDPGAASWTTANAFMPTPSSNLCGAVIGGDIYIPGGYTGTAYLNTLQVYTPATDSWQTIATDPLPAGLSGPACAASGGKLYVFGGSATGTYVAETYVYDPAAAAGSRSSSGASAPVTGAYGDAIAVDGYIYYAGMRNATTDLTDVHRYDPAGNSWTTMPSLTTARGAARMWAYEGKLAVGGGGWSTYLTSVEEYDLSTGTGGSWTAGNSLVAGRRTFAVAQDNVDGVLYAGAGYNGTFMTAAESSTWVIPVELVGFTVD